MCVFRDENYLENDAFNDERKGKVEKWKFLYIY